MSKYIYDYNEFLNEFKFMSAKEMAGWIGLGIASAIVYDAAKKLPELIKSDEEKLAKLKAKLADEDKESVKVRIQTKITEIETKLEKDRQKLKAAQAKLAAEKAKAKDNKKEE